MSRSRTIEVVHSVLAAVVRKHGTRQVFDLLEVRYEYAVPADTEFPRIVPRFDLFLRVLSHGAGPTAIRVRVRRRLGRGNWELVHDLKPTRVLPFPRAGTFVLDQPIPVANVHLTGTGLYVVTVYFRPPRSRWRLGAAEYFRVVR